MSTDTYWFYILASRPNGTLYTGITRDLRTRLDLNSIAAAEALNSSRNIAAPARSRRGVRIATGSDRTRKTVEELAPRLENSVNREREFQLE